MNTVATNLMGLATVMQAQFFECFDECKCLLHTTISCGIKKGSGCASARPGSYPPIAAAYRDRQGHHACLATAAQRKGDARLAQAMMQVDLDFGEEFPDDYVSEEEMKDLEAPHYCWEDFGAGYCYLKAIRAVHRSRIARLLGPLPYIADVLRAVKFCGRQEMKVLDLKLVVAEDHLYHVTHSPWIKGQNSTAGFWFASELFQILAKYPDARVGAGVTEGLEWLMDKDLFLPIEARDDLDVALRTAVAQRVEEDKVRLRVLAAVGDSALRLNSAVSVCRDKQSVEQFSRRITTYQSDVNLAALTVTTGLADCVLTANGVSLASAKVGSTALEAVFGVLYIHLGMEAVVKLAKNLGVD